MRTYNISLRIQVYGHIADIVDFLKEIDCFNEANKNEINIKVINTSLEEEDDFKEKLLGLKVDLVTERSINTKLKKYIYKDLKVIYQ